jgi:hypothetical protein
VSYYDHDDQVSNRRGRRCDHTDDGDDDDECRDVPVAASSSSSKDGSLAEARSGDGLEDEGLEETAAEVSDFQHSLLGAAVMSEMVRLRICDLKVLMSLCVLETKTGLFCRLVNSAWDQAHWLPCSRFAGDDQWLAHAKFGGEKLVG